MTDQITQQQQDYIHYLLRDIRGELTWVDIVRWGKIGRVVGWNTPPEDFNIYDDDCSDIEEDDPCDPISWDVDLGDEEEW